jgi:hypothetical protein
MSRRIKYFCKHNTTLAAVHCPECWTARVREAAAEYQATEHGKAKRLAWRDKNRTLLAENADRWRTKNPEKYRIYHRAYQRALYQHQSQDPKWRDKTNRRSRERYAIKKAAKEKAAYALDP